MPHDPAPIDRRAHWDGVYLSKEQTQLSWHQDEPRLSLTLAREHCRSGSRVIDVGGGTSLLAGLLTEAGCAVSVLDISEAALQRARQRVGEAAGRIQWLCHDITADPPPPLGQFDLWHDRAVFHFLTDAEDRRRYVRCAKQSVAPGGHLILATFALDGPEQCSNLPVQRHDDASIAAEFAPGFALVKSLRETHTTPWGKPQAFTYVVMKRAT